ncbi:MAG: hypothetical protein RR343_05880 [Oscillospiraceae bacterium]
MKKILSLALVVFTFVCVLSGCGSDIYYDGKYDSENFALNTDIDGVRFLIPVDYNNMKQTQEEINKKLQSIKNENDKIKFINSRVTYVTNGTDYQLVKPNEFFLYVLNLKGLKGVESFDDVADLPKTFGIKKFISLEAGNVEKHSSVTKNGCTRSIFNANIKDLETRSEYYGYVSIIEDSSKGTVYAIIAGFGDKEHYNTTKAIAENFYLAE